MNLSVTSELIHIEKIILETVGACSMLMVKRELTIQGGRASVEGRLVTDTY